MSWTILLDNEAVQALADPSHRKHRRAVGYAQVAISRKARADPVNVAVPAAVRVEAGWDRTAPAWAFVNRLRIADIPLDRTHANTAAAISSRTGVSVAELANPYDTVSVCFSKGLGAPAGSANRNSGRLVATWTRETISGLGSRLVMSHPEAALFIQEPTFETTVAIHR